MEQIDSTEFVVDFVTTAGALGTDDEDDKPEGRQTFNTPRSPLTI